MKKISFALLCAFAAATVAVNAQPYKNSDLPAQERAKDLVGRLTLEQKAALMQNGSPAIPEFRIKAYDWWNEALHGVGRAGLATVFPQAIGMAASFDDALLLDVFTAVSDEARAKSAQYSENGGLRRYQGLTFWTPNVNIFRDPRWGRGQETYGEDPYLTSRMGVSVVNGLQGPADAKYDKLHACAKHFAVHSGPEWNRHVFNAEDIAARDLRETYLPAFKALVQEADVKEVMCAYNRYEDEPCCGSSRLLQQILRNEWGYKGIVVSDCWAINDFFTEGHHNTEPDAKHATSKAVLTGTDLECGSSYANLPQAVKDGLIKESDIDLSLTRLLTARFELGEMDDPALVEWTKIPYSTVDSKEHRALALKMAQESMVLLKNNGILPLNTAKKVVVMGPNANDSVMQWGNYNGTPSRTVTLLEALQSTGADVKYMRGCDYASNSMALVSLFSQCKASGQQGFDAKYWNNARGEGEPDVLRHNATPLRFSTGGATVFAPNVNLEDFAAVYTSTFHADEDGQVAFFMQNQGQASISVNGRRVAMGRNGTEARKVYTLDAKAGQDYEITINYSCRRGEASLSFDLGYEVEVSVDKTVAECQGADVVIFAGGISPSLEGEEMPVSIDGFRGGDRTKIELPTAQTELVKALKAAGLKVVFVNFSGSAMGLTEVEPACDAILQAWYPGEEGGNAIKSVLYGEYNPGGRLPVTFYASTAQLPDFEDYSMKGRTYRYMTEKPLYPFGYGLSYSKFTYKGIKIKKSGENYKVSLKVKNNGKMDGDEVVQVYVRRPSDTEGPSHALRAFKRVNIGAGKTQKVEIELTPEQFEWFDPNINLMNVLPGQYEVLVGGNSNLSELKSLKVTL
ncbi:MAG: glycoside hydrolase family 3 C-terminal domain-containing protein [Bacteroidaceae bacterium]|nr:glycoside hydrolase family 3 C-terminal domain-containing protein [Bacteroidaceae bacterium]